MKTTTAANTIRRLNVEFSRTAANTDSFLPALAFRSQEEGAEVHRPSAELEVVIRPVDLSRPIVPDTGTRYCPGCRSIVYSRRHRLCGVCGEPLPAAYLFAPSEAARIEQLMNAERTRHREWLARVAP